MILNSINNMPKKSFEEWSSLERLTYKNTVSFILEFVKLLILMKISKQRKNGCYDLL